jgi:Arc/MetJ-type ribon-helix-helix transcriptional regulator
MSVCIFAKFSEEEARTLDKMVRDWGLLNRSELIREAVRFYLSLMCVESVSRLRILRALNELFGSSGKRAGELIEELRKEDEL